MTTLTKAGVAVVGVGTLGGGAILANNLLNKSEDIPKTITIETNLKSFEKELGESVLKLVGNDNQKEWGERAKELATSTSQLDASLNKQTVKTWEQLRDWCNGSRNDTFDKDSVKYKNFEEFCTWKVGDKLTGHIPKETVESDGKWRTAHAALKGKNNLPQSLKDIVSTAEANDADKKAMRKWCTDSYKENWVGSKDTKVALVKEHCKLNG
ncbi:hypothetical protein A6V39_04510 [Candidatus Mycoplasma haematobovis]|uniref:Uncharacterized protein n=1 Tax=Candidatus Mycoplasma haematobovis TaxID=432608 RepID=A0A1A9QCF0_9MOLU|nr:hypothetical protein [Candidatus Mycoplasma haematobovis]OAL10147.1 hypothetical protein A6V39_04510 [Candidatus Mycoplasma haematobovis]